MCLRRIDHARPAAVADREIQVVVSNDGATWVPAPGTPVGIDSPDRRRTAARPMTTSAPLLVRLSRQEQWCDNRHVALCLRRAGRRRLGCRPIDGPGFDITFHGVRGSTPCHGDDVVAYGGNTSCVSVDVPGHQPIMFDLGTGARYFGVGVGRRTSRSTACVYSSHLHWDHIQGLPFFTPVLRAGSCLDLHTPVPGRRHRPSPR